MYLTMPERKAAAGSYGTSYDITGSNGGSILQSGFKRDQPGNNGVGRETTTQTDLGFDFSLFAQTLYGSFDWYYKKTTDILVQMAGIATMGEGSKQWINAGEMENKGFELNLGYRNSTKPGLKYDINANLSSYRNKITALPATVAALNGTFGGNGVESVIGHPNGAQVGYVADGLFKSQEEIDNHATQEGAGSWDASAGVIWTATVSSTKKTSNGYSTLHLPSATVSISIWNIRTSILPCFGKAYKE